MSLNNSLNMSDSLVSVIVDAVGKFQELAAQRVIESQAGNMRHYIIKLINTYQETFGENEPTQAIMDHFMLQAIAIHKAFLRTAKKKREKYDQCVALSSKTLLQRAAESINLNPDLGSQPLSLEAPIEPSPSKKPRLNPIDQRNVIQEQAQPQRTDKDDQTEGSVLTNHNILHQMTSENRPKSNPPHHGGGDNADDSAGDISSLFSSDDEKMIEPDSEWYPSDEEAEWIISDTDMFFREEEEKECANGDRRGMTMESSRHVSGTPSVLGKRKQVDRRGLQWTPSEDAALLKILRENPNVSRGFKSDLWERHHIPGRSTCACVARIKVYLKDGRLKRRFDRTDPFPSHSKECNITIGS